MKIIGIYGASGFGREVLPLLRLSRDSSTKFYFIDDYAEGSANGVEILGFDGFCSLDGEKGFVIAIADTNIRRKLAARCERAGLTSLNVIAPDVVIRDASEVGDGAIVCDRAIITTNVVIGRYFHANVHCYVAHDCVVGDFVTLAPGAICNGNVCLGDDVYVGANAVIKQGTPDKPLRIGAGAVIGMGAVVTKDVPAGTTVVGNPARPLVR